MFTKEQNEIIDQVKDFNLIVEAVAGSGKTTTAIGIAEKYPDKKILLVTYNAALKTDTRKKTKNLSNMEVENYHSLSLNYYNASKYQNDEGVLEVIENDYPLVNNFEPDILILDEVQDMDINYFRLIKKLIKDLKIKPTICVFGDSKQTLYAYKGSDYRFLQKADRLFASDKPWKRLTLSESFRITKPIANFINNVYYKNDFIVSNKDSDEPVDYLFYNPYSQTSEVNYIEHLLKEINKYGAENTFILATSVKLENGKNPLSIFNNEATKQLPIYVKDNLKVNNKKVSKNKLNITTINSTKGQEKDLVIIFGFDSFYYSLASNKDVNVPEDLFYVAMTRAKKKLILLNVDRESPFPFLDIDKLETYANVLGRNIQKSKMFKNVRENTFNVTKMCEHLPFYFLHELQKNIKVTETKIESDINFNNLTSFVSLDYLGKKITEEVAWINGSLVTTILQDFDQMNAEAIFEQLKSESKTILKNDPNFYWQNKNLDHVSELISKVKTKSIPVLTEWTLIKDMFFSKSNHNYLQILDSGFKWLDQSFYDEVLEIMKTINFSNEWRVEKLIVYSGSAFKEVEQKFGKILTVEGIVDAYDESTETLWEFKIVNQVTLEMYLQVCIYVYLQKLSKKVPKSLKLFNLYNKTIYEIEVDLEWFAKFFNRLLAFKLSSEEKTSDSDFFREVNKF